MDWPDLGQPAPREEIKPHQPLAWPAGQRIPIGEVTAAVQQSEVARFLKSRRTLRDFGAMSPSDLGDWLDLSCRVQQVQRSGLGFDLSRRPAPSAGAIHPIHLVFAFPEETLWRRYDAVDHALLTFSSRLDALEVRSGMQAVLAAPHATLILLAAEPARTDAKYSSAASLVWRDAGALLATMGIAAHALSLAFCPLGVTGEPWTSRLLEEKGLVGVGAAFLGRPRGKP